MLGISGRYEFQFLASQMGGGGVVIPDMASAYISFGPGCLLRLCRVDSLLTVGLEPLPHPLRSDSCVIPPGVVEWACNDDWFDTASPSDTQAEMPERHKQVRSCRDGSDTGWGACGNHGFQAQFFK